jgi:purine-binding chemotaxis protein CheW
VDKKIVGFRLKDEEFAFDIMRVIEIIKIKEITEVPTAPDFIEGVINLRGKIIPIIDLRKRFGLESAESVSEQRIIIVEFDKGQYTGVVVDQVSKVINILPEQVLPAPASVKEEGAVYIESIIKIEERVIVLLDIEKIFSADEQFNLREITQLHGGKL